MYGNTQQAAQVRRDLNGPGLFSLQQRPGHIKIDKSAWQTVSLSEYCHPARIINWEPAMAIRCPICKRLFHVGSKHFSDANQGCRPLLAIEKVQHGLHLLARDYGQPRRYLSIDTITHMVSQGLNLENIHAQEPTWLPNEPVRIFDINGTWVSSGLTITNLYDNAPQEVRMEPIAQDGNANVQNQYQVQGNIVFSPRRIARRKNKVWKVSYRTDLQDTFPLLFQHYREQEEMIILKEQVGHCKRMLLDMSQNGTIPNNIVLQLLALFSANGQNAYVAPSATPPVAAAHTLNPIVPNHAQRDQVFNNLQAKITWITANP